MDGKNPISWKAAALPLAAVTAAFAAGIAYFAGGGGTRDAGPAAPAADIKFDSGPRYAPGTGPLDRPAAGQGGSSIDMFRAANKGYYREGSSPAAPSAAGAPHPRGRAEMEAFLSQVRHQVKYDAAAAPGGEEDEGPAAPGARAYNPAGLRQAGPSALSSPDKPALRSGGAADLGGGPAGRISAFGPGRSGAPEPALHGPAAARQQRAADLEARASGSSGGMSSGRALSGGGQGGGTGMTAGEYGSHGGGSGASMPSSPGMQQAGETVNPAPIEFLWPNTVNFGDMYMYETSARQAIVMNIGNAPLKLGKVENIDDETPFFVEKDKCSSATLQPGKSCTFVIRFAPRTARDYITAFYVPGDDDGAYYQAYMEVRGNSKYSPFTSWWHSRWSGYTYGRGNKADFGMVPEGYSMSETLRVSNTGGGTWHGVKLDASGLPASFKLSGDGCAGADLAGGQSCTVTVVFTPTAAVNRKFSTPYYGQYNAVDSATGARVHDPRPKFPPLLMESPEEAYPKGEIKVTASVDDDNSFARRQEVLSVPVSGVSCAPFPVPGLTRIQRYYYFEK